MIFDLKKHQGIFEDISKVSHLGLTMAGCIGLCFFIGYWLDRWFGTSGIFITIFIILGVIGGGFTVYREIDKFLGLSKKKKGSDTEKKDNG